LRMPASNMIAHVKLAVWWWQGSRTSGRESRHCDVLCFVSVCPSGRRSEKPATCLPPLRTVSPPGIPDDARTPGDPILGSPRVLVDSSWPGSIGGSPTPQGHSLPSTPRLTWQSAMANRVLYHPPALLGMTTIGLPTNLEPRIVHSKASCCV